MRSCQRERDAGDVVREWGRQGQRWIRDRDEVVIDCGAENKIKGFSERARKVEGRIGAVRDNERAVRNRFEAVGTHFQEVRTHFRRCGHICRRCGYISGGADTFSGVAGTFPGGAETFLWAPAQF